MFATRKVSPGSAIGRSSPLASSSLRAHLLRGLAGLVVGVAAIYLVSVVGAISLLLLTFTAAAWRGCPTCWTVGLIGTMADARERRGCSRCGEASRSGMGRATTD
jgi:hypothetical protein